MTDIQLMALYKLLGGFTFFVACIVFIIWQFKRLRAKKYKTMSQAWDEAKQVYRDAKKDK